MTRVIEGIVIAALTVSLAATVMAQSKTITKEQRTTTATIEAIDPATRMLSLKKSDGQHVDVRVPDEVKRFSTLKVGETISATYYENVVLILKPSTLNEPAVDKASSARTAATSGARAGTFSTQQTITATIDAIDMKVPSISFKGPRGWTYTSKVEDKAALSKVKVGDRVDITWTEALLVSVDPPKAK
jgi:hypothetical protein